MNLNYYFKYLAISGLFLPGLVSAGTGPDPQLEEAQAKVAQAYQSYFKHAGRPGADTALSQSLGSLNSLVNDREKQAENHFFGKVFDENGNVIGDAPSAGGSAKILGQSSISGSRAPASSGNSPNGGASVGTFGRSRGRGLHGPAHEEFVLDGSKIKKEMVFGKPSNPEKQ